MNMSNRYPFMGDKTRTLPIYGCTQDGTVIWSEQVEVQSTLDFSNVSEATLTDSINDSYATAIEDNETQYLSVLETTGDVTLEDLHSLTLNSKMATQESLEFNNDNTLTENLDVNTVDMGDQQVVVFTLDGSDDLYGIQISQDEDGNMQKYQFKFRMTEDGQLEAIPESVELLPNDTEPQNENAINANEVLVQEIETVETDGQDTPVYYSEDVQEGNMQEAQVYIQQEEAADEHVELQQQNENLTVYIKGEKDSTGFQEPVEDREYAEETEDQFQDNEELHYEETETEVLQGENYEEVEDVKADIMEESLALQTPSTNIKQELLQEDSRGLNTYSEESQNYHPYQNQEEISQVQYDHNVISEEQTEEHSEQDEHCTTVEIEGDHETVLQYQQYIPGDIQQVYEASDITDGQDLQQETHYEQLFVRETHSVSEKTGEFEDRDDEEEEADEQFVAETGTENDSDNDDYQIVEGLHITADGDIDEGAASPVQEPETILQEVIEKPPVLERANILKQTSLLKPMKEVNSKTNKTVVYYVVPHLEKENVNSLPINNTTSYRTIRSNNPRTILKSSFPEFREDGDIKSIADERLNKRFARSKEAVQARLFNNFISKTTIPHAPVRQTRLPRKQQIKPVDNRRNEEIIVQEVMVSSKGFIENVEERLKNTDKLEVTEYVVLTDSDDDYDPKQGKKKKKKHKKHKKTDAADTDSDVSVIEIRSDDEPEDEMQQEKDKDNPKRGRGRPKKSPETIEGSEGMKRRRGRPPKIGSGESEESPAKKSRTESDEDSTKKEIKCPHCPKTFPSQNSLSTHIQHHNLENSLRNKAGVSQSIGYKHKCDNCQEAFKNSILLKRHTCEKQAPQSRTRLECVTCKKTFPSLHTLNIHKRSHIKENLVNTTSVARVSPKKIVPRASTARLRSPRRVTESKSTFKCKECSRVCYSQESLTLHEKTHRKYKCSSCNAVFPSRLLLDTHVRVNCVKTASPGSKRLSFKIRKTYVQSPRRKSIKFGRKSVAPNLNSTSAGMNSTLNLKLECSTCGETFQAFQDKFKHQVQVHGLETPNKSILAKPEKRLHKPKNVHGGIPARDNMTKAFAKMKNKIALVTPTKDAN